LGTFLNTATVAVGGYAGYLVGQKIPQEYQSVAMSGLALVVVGLGLKMFFSAKHIMIIAGSVAIGGVIGVLLGLQAGVNNFATWTMHVFGGEHAGRFVEAVVTTSILFCVGPMTLLGCLREALEGNMELLMIKSTLDGIGAFFFAAALGPGVLVTAGVVLILQSLITFLARPLQPLVADEEVLSEITGAGGIMLVGIGLGILKIKDLPMTDYLPALVLAPCGVYLMRIFARRKQPRVNGEV
jgi:uncharacterized membrane protein YqgA involved in biofilm formation